jgi:recombination protein RecT
MAEPKSRTAAPGLTDKIAGEAGNKSNLPATAGGPPANDQPTTWKSFLEKNKAEIELVLPSIVRKSGGAERMVRLSLSVVRRNPKLLQCSPQSVLSAIIECASLGLEPETPLNQAHLVPFSSSKTNQLECTLIIDYRGLLDLCYNSGQIDFIRALPVFKQDKFKYEYGSKSYLFHLPCDESHEYKDVTHFYAECRLKSGSYNFLVWSRKKVEEHRDRFAPSWNPKKPNDSPWGTDPIPMGQKTMIRQLVNILPRSSENRSLYQALAVDEQPVPPDPLKYNFEERVPLDQNKEV